MTFQAALKCRIIKVGFSQCSILSFLPLSRPIKLFTSLGVALAWFDLNKSDPATAPVRRRSEARAEAGDPKVISEHRFLLFLAGECLLILSAEH